MVDDEFPPVLQSCETASPQRGNLTAMHHAQNLVSVSKSPVNSFVGRPVMGCVCVNENTGSDTYVRIAHRKMHSLVC